MLALGRLADPLIAHANAAHAALVVVGSHHAHGIGRYSSVASGVLHVAQSSVLVIPHEAPAVVARPWRAIRRVVVATDRSAFAADAVHQAYGLVAPSRGEVVVLEVLPPPSDDRTLAEAQSALRALVPTRPPDGVTSRVEAVFDDDVAAGILHAAARAGADCIVLASHGRSGIRKLVLGSVAQAVVQRSDRPVLIVRPSVDA